MQYNTQNDKLLIADYGRTVQNMVRHAQALTDRDERTKCAYTIVKTMAALTNSSLRKAEVRQKLWNHIAEIADYELDIDYPVTITPREERESRPEPLPYPMKRINMRHYGSNIEATLKLLADMPDSPARNRIIAQTANQMKRLLCTQVHDSRVNDRVIADIARYTDGKVTLPANFRFAGNNVKSKQGSNGLASLKKKKKKR